MRVLIGLAMAAAFAAAQPALNVTYIANAGFLIEGGGQKVLVDALFDQGFREYLTPSAETLAALGQAAPDLILVTHAHGDHINPKLVIAHLRQNAKAQLAAHTQAIEQMRQEEGFAEVAGRVQEIRLELGAWERRTLNGITFDAICLAHGTQEGPVRNLAFLVTLGGMRFLHTGDAQFAYNAGRLAAYPFEEARLNVLFDGYPYPGDKDFIEGVVRPEHLVVMHVGQEEWEREEKRVHALLPQAVIFSKSGERRTFRPAPDPALEVTYIANEGFLVEGGGRRVLIDALFDSGFGQYLTPAPETLAGLADVDVILSTHWHPDHLNPKLAIAHLRRNGKARMVAHSQTVNRMRQEEGFAEVAGQIQEVKLEPGGRERLTVNGVTLDALCLEHGAYMRDGRNVHAGTRNLAFVVNLGGLRFLHIGDANLQQSAAHLGAYPFREERIAVMFGAQPSGVIAETIKPSHLVAMHIEPAQLEEERRMIHAVYPGAFVFSRSLERRVFRAGVDFHALSGPYLGQTPPGATPQRFAPGIICTPRLEHSAAAFSPDGSQVYWSVVTTGTEKTVLTMRRTADGWTAPRVAPFSAPHADGPVFSPDGRRLYFTSKRARPGAAAAADGPGDIWYVEKQGEGWSEPNCLCLTARFPDLGFAAGPSFARDGAVYFMAQGGIHVARWVDGRYTAPQALPASINMPDMLNWTPYIAPDESYLIFSSNRRDPKGDAGDLYISYRSPDGAWADPAALGAPVNTGWQERFPLVSPDGKYLFFTRPTPSGSQDVFWVSAEGIAKNTR